MKYKIEIAVITCITLLLIGDYFSTFVLANGISKWILLIVIVVLFTRSKRWNRKDNPTSGYKWHLFLILYTVLIIGILTLLGGKSQVGISFYNPFFWIIMGIAMLEMVYSARKKDKGD
ncbi:hypothetical protein GH741_20875 [Aquibacillus halophilus]|uniref:Uncharacterized protein n=1 Tax=Aquibacillus halophilus TaxID=930132 RepID=A0A6A8DMU8_9BACI|nr:hypothetical protein [Aquibacillus halophilus]MRH45099.1 hypothetical protein [Aquibacillus halophilus]